MKIKKITITNSSKSSYPKRTGEVKILSLVKAAEQGT